MNVLMHVFVCGCSGCAHACENQRLVSVSSLITISHMLRFRVGSYPSILKKRAPWSSNNKLKPQHPLRS